MDGSGARSLEQALVDVPGIEAVEIERGPHGPRTLRLSVGDGRDRESVMAEVHRVLADEFGLALEGSELAAPREYAPLRSAAPEGTSFAPGPHTRVDGPRLSLVPVPEGAPAPVPSSGEVPVPQPPVCTRVRVERRGLAAVAEVRLRSAHGSADGSAEGAPTPAGMRRAVADAAAAALRSLPTRPGADPVRIDVDDVTVVPLAGGSTAVVSLTRTTGGGSVTAVGAAPVHRDDRVAVVRAVLDAAGGAW